MSATRTLEFAVKGQQITCDYAIPEAVNESREYLHAHFAVDEAWSGLTIFALFYNRVCAAEPIELDETMTCAVPAVVLEKPVSEFLVGLVGYGANGYRLTTDRAGIDLGQAAYTSGETPPPPAPDVYAALLEQVVRKLDANQGAEHAGKALIVGEDGGVVPGAVQGGVTSVNGQTGDVKLGLVVTVTEAEDGTMTASHSASEIIAHVEAGGSATLDVGSGLVPYYATLYGMPIFIADAIVESNISRAMYFVQEDKTVGLETTFYAPPSSDMIITITANDDGTYATDTAYADIAAAIAAGKNVIARRVIVSGSGTTVREYQLAYDYATEDTASTQAVSFVYHFPASTSELRAEVISIYDMTHDTVPSAEVAVKSYKYSHAEMTGATEAEAGAAGLVPAPAAGYGDRALMATGEFAPVVPAPATAAVGDILRVAAVDEAGVPTAWEAVDLPAGEVTDEYITLANFAFAADTLYSDVWANEDYSGAGAHIWKSAEPLDLICISVYVPDQTANETIVTTGELKLSVMSDDIYTFSWEFDGAAPYLGRSGFITANGQNRWVSAVFDLAEGAARCEYADNVKPKGNYYNGYVRAIPSFSRAYAKSNYLQAAFVRLISGSLPAGTEIFIYGRKYNENRSRRPGWSVSE